MPYKTSDLNSLMPSQVKFWLTNVKSQRNALRSVTKSSPFYDADLNELRKYQQELADATSNGKFRIGVKQKEAQFKRNFWILFGLRTTSNGTVQQLRVQL